MAAEYPERSGQASIEQTRQLVKDAERPAITINAHSSDHVQEIENLWREQARYTHSIATYPQDIGAAGWSVTSITESFICVPKMVSTTHYGTNFALEVYEANLRDPPRLKSVINLDSQPSAVTCEKSLVIVSTGHPRS